MSNSDPSHSNYEAATTGGSPPKLLGSAFCVGQDSEHWYFVTSHHVFVGEESDYVRNISRMFVGAWAKTEDGKPWFQIPVNYVFPFSSPTPNPNDKYELVLFRCKRALDADIVPLPLSAEVLKPDAEVAVYGVLKAYDYYTHGKLDSFSGKVIEFSHFMNRHSLASGSAYVVASEMPHGLSGGCCVVDGAVVGVNTSGFSEDVRCTVESILPLLTMSFQHVFSWVGTPMPSPAIHAPFVVSGAPGSEATRMAFSACGFAAAVAQARAGNSAALRNWGAGLVGGASSAGLWLEDFNLVGQDREIALGVLLGEFLEHYRNTGVKVPLSITPISAVYP